MKISSLGHKAALWASLVVLLGVTASVALAQGDGGEAPKAPVKMLLVGDSMVWELGRALEPLMEADGYDFRWKHKTSESIRGYAGGNKMREHVRKHSPDVVLISLGANEALIPKPEALVRPIQKIVSQVGDRPCLWIGPPMWTQDTGVVKILEEHVAPCRFYNSSPLELARRKDGYHPNKEGSAVWASALQRWLRDNPLTSAAP